MKTQKNICTPMLIAALFTIAELKQPVCQWMKCKDVEDVVCVCVCVCVCVLFFSY